MDIDATEEIRRALIPQTHDLLAAHVAAGGRTYDTAELQASFDVLGFLAPFVVVREKFHGKKKGSLMFTHSPRVYFDFQVTE